MDTGRRLEENNVLCSGKNTLLTGRVRADNNNGQSNNPVVERSLSLPKVMITGYLSTLMREVSVETLLVILISWSSSAAVKSLKDV